MADWLLAGPASKRLGLHPRTLAKLADRGLIEYIRTCGNHRRYDVSSVRGPPVVKKIQEAPTTKGAVYCRVSSKKQADDLVHQTKEMQCKYPGYKVFTDVASGLNFKRKGLKRHTHALIHTYAHTHTHIRGSSCRYRGSNLATSPPFQQAEFPASRTFSHEALGIPFRQAPA